MNILITSAGDTLRSKVDRRFGRSAWFCIYNNTTKAVEFILNPNKEINGGAGTKTTETIAELGVERVISGDFGPKAKMLLEKLKIEMVILDETNLTVGDIIARVERNA